ncbi:uncharacterized protein GGS25DRAFT_258538 [Hypoxylon fragiforme]|uniref:uncharacterized protein n=1 Tax=Hypoxylon fragiforme TaxID=63214 RepID=UPI0020C5BE07|nr:uncharacterized protein GGS25DRAFT_258538 [Hypoxylon fragiforme]KAI2610377.1 hypothetical protein GGS25DRAFT_258538 [Hypoxylon fragiforme]
MQKRRSHKKSRNGCQNCKRWHTKCDEQGPPCNNCTLRKAKCVYTRPNIESTPGGGGILTIRSKERQAARCPTSVERPQGNIGALCSAYGGPSRLLELELMHQWSVSTYKCFVGIPEDCDYLQVALPRASLQYDFMLNCIMAISSLQIAKSVGESHSAKYVNAALEFYNRGSSSFRTHLGSLNADNCHVLYMFSAIAVAVHLAIPQRSASVIEMVTVAFDLMNGSTSIGMMGMPWLLGSQFPLRLFINRLGASSDLIDPDTRVALARLRSLNDQLHNPNEGTETLGVAALNSHELFGLAIHYLEMCFAEETKGMVRGFGTAFPSLVGKHFTALLSKSDPFAFLITTHWAVLLNTLDKDYWWMESIAKKFVMEASVLLTKPLSLESLDWEDAVSWVLDRIGLATPLPLELTYGTDADILAIEDMIYGESSGVSSASQ